jgi:hypothetical protein
MEWQDLLPSATELAKVGAEIVLLGRDECAEPDKP